MHVLMFGWEFPPQISGGLGAACFGLTESFRKSKTEILFVIPHADDNTLEEGRKIMSASTFFVPVRSSEIYQELPVKNHRVETTCRGKVLRKFHDVHFVMAGSGYLVPEMIERIARLRIASRFHFTGFFKEK